MAAPKVVQQLANQRTMVLGGTSGIGSAVASGLIEEGASVLVASSQQSKVDATVVALSDPKQQFNASADRVAGAVVDLGQGEKTEDALEKLFAALPPQWGGKVDNVVLTAAPGLPRVAPIDQIKYEDALETFEVRVGVPILVAKVATKYIAQGGAIIFTGGVLAQRPSPGMSLLSIHSALSALAATLSLDYAQKGLNVRVNLISCGPVETPLYAGFPQAAQDHMNSLLITKRTAAPETVAQTYLSVLKDKTVFGQTILTDSGYVIHT